MAWMYLLIAGIMEWAWPIGLKYAWTAQGVKFWPALLATAAMLVSGFFLLLAQREIPVGAAYAVWTGIGAVGVFILGIAFLGEPIASALSPRPEAIHRRNQPDRVTVSSLGFQVRRE